MNRSYTVPALAAILVAVMGCDAAPFSPAPAPAPASVRIDIPQPLLIEGDSMRLGFTVLNARGAPIDHLPPWAEPRWTARHNDALLVRDDGTALGVQPGDAVVSVELAGLTASRAVRVDPEVITMDVVAAYLVQTVQRTDGSIPIIAGKDALLRIFVQGDAASNQFTPPVHVVLHRDGAPIDSLVIPAGSPRVPHTLNEDAFAWSWNVRIPGDRVRPGLSFRVALDPDETVPRRSASRVTFPADGGLHAVDIRELPPHRVLFVPVHQSGSGITGNVTVATAPRFFGFFERLFPVPSVEFQVRAPYSTSAVVAENSGWLQLLGEIQALRAAEGSTVYYYGVVRPAGGSWGGFAMIGTPVAVGFDHATWAPALFAHETGHNFGRRHAPCGGAAGVDPAFPYPNAAIGVTGYDVGTGEVRPSDMRDIMSYCYQWISDYTYDAAWRFRAREGDRSFDVAADREDVPVLLVWGRIAADGTAVLEPAFELLGRPTAMPEPGPFTVQGLDAGGAVLFSRSFAGDEVGHGVPGTRLFAFTVPLGHEGSRTVHRIQLVGPGASATLIRAVPDGRPRPEVARRALPTGQQRLTWTGADYPMALVRDRTTGQILSFSRDGRTELPAGTGDVDVLLSNGTGSVPARVRDQVR
jgi:hypothetical protein